MTCTRAAFLFDDYLFDRLDPETRAALEEHLRSCPACSDAFENEKALVEFIQTDKSPEPGDEYWSSLEKVILARTVDRIEPAEVESDITRRGRSRALLNYLVPLAASIALLAGSLADLGLKPRGTMISDLSAYGNLTAASDGETISGISLGSGDGISPTDRALCLNIQTKSHLLGSVVMSPPGSAGRGIKVSQMTITRDIQDEHEK